MKRLLVTGSRWGVPRSVLEHELKAALEYLGGPLGDGEQVTLVHGAAPGVDQQAGALWASWGYPVEVHRADWEHFGWDAGPMRNQEMVDAGADLCLALPRAESKGTYDCVRKARKAGIETWVVDPNTWPKEAQE